MMNASPTREPLVTIALPAHNAGRYLQLAVLSLVNQSMADFELLVFDDWGNDPAVERLKLLNDPRINIIADGRNLGLAARLNQAIGMAKGQYFARMDHDDISHPDRLARQLEFLQQNPGIDLLATACVTIDERDQLVGMLPHSLEHADICRRPWQGFYMPHPTWMGKSDWFKRHLYSPDAPYFCEDQELLLRAYEISCFHALEEPLLAYRVRSNPPLGRRLKTRRALAKVQMNYFLTAKNPAHAALSSAVCLARMGMDLASAVGVKSSKSTEPVSAIDAKTWPRIIDRLLAQSSGVAG